MGEMKLGSLFDGSGGFPLAACLCGITPVWASEIEPYPIAVTRNRFPEMKHLGNVSTVNGADIEPVDIITFGSPCQDMSMAGRRDGLDGKRSSLFYEAVRIIKEMRCATNGKYPRYIVWENVPGAFSSNRGEDFKAVLEAVIGIAEPNAQVPMPEKARWPYADLFMGDGWSVAYRTLDAQYWGVPQRRRRIYLVADFTGGCAGKILFEREGLRGHFTEGRTPWETTAGDVAGSARTTDSTAKRMIPSVLSAGFIADSGSKAHGIGYELEKSPTIRAGGTCETVCCVWDARWNGDGDKSSTITGDHENRITDYTNVVCLQGNCIDRNAKQGGSGVKEDVSFTLNTVDRHAVAYKREPKYIVRRLTPTECARLQGFPDTWDEIERKSEIEDDEYSFWLGVRNTHAAINGKVAKEYTKEQMLVWYNKLHTDSAEYKMWGNGIALPTALYVMQGIGNCLNSK